MAKPAWTRDEYVDNHIAQRQVYGSKQEWIDEPYLRARAARAFDRCYCPAGVGRQMQAIMRDGNRADGLRAAAGLGSPSGSPRSARLTGPGQIPSRPLDHSTRAI